MVAQGFERGDKFRGGPGLPLPWSACAGWHPGQPGEQCGRPGMGQTDWRHLLPGVSCGVCRQVQHRVRARMGRRRDEFGDLAQDFDSMTGQLEALLVHNAGCCMIFPRTALTAGAPASRHRPGAANPQQLDATGPPGARSHRLDGLVDEVLTWQAGFRPGVSSQSFDLLALLDEGDWRRPVRGGITA